MLFVMLKKWHVIERSIFGDCTRIFTKSNKISIMFQCMMSCLSAFVNNLWVQAIAIVGLAALATIAAVIRLYAHITCGR